MTVRPRDGANQKEGKWLGQLAPPLKDGGQRQVAVAMFPCIPSGGHSSPIWLEK